MTSTDPRWICCQIGSREHYAIPRAVAGSGALEAFYTDAWIEPGSLFGRVVPLRLQERHHADLAGQPVKSRTASLLGREFYWRLRRIQEWPKIIRRNQWFQEWVMRELKARNQAAGQKILFSYSYAAHDLFSYARSRGWVCVLGQIDPGIIEEQIVAELYSRSRLGFRNWRKAPPGYWARWREECGLADVIIVNSNWCREALLREGLPADKLVVVPLVYQAPAGSDGFERHYPKTFSKERPLRLLFLGQVILRKGIEEIREAMKCLRGEPVELWLVGPDNGDWPKEEDGGGIRRIGIVSRGETAKYYQAADVFLFPSHSDGFGLTQLEAQAWKLPIIASRNCGEVVVNGINGLLLDDVQPSSIIAAIRHLVQQPDQLVNLSAGSRLKGGFGLIDLAERLAVALRKRDMRSRQIAAAVQRQAWLQ